MKVLLFVLLSSPFLHGQNSNLDSLFRVVTQLQEDTNKINLLNDLAWDFRGSNLTLARECALEAEKISLKLNFERGYVTSLVRRGSVDIDEGKYETAEKIYLNVLELEKKLDSPHGITRAHNQLGTIYRDKRELNKALNFYSLAYKGFVELADTNNQAISLNNMSKVYKDLGKYDLALSYLHKSTALRKKSKNFKKLGKEYLSLGSLYLEMEDFEQALSYYLKAKELFIEQNEQNDLSKAYHNIGLLYAQTDQLDLALNQYSKALELKKKLGIEASNSLLYSNIGSVYYRKKDFSNARRYYQIAVNIQESSSEGHQSWEAYSNLGNIYLEQKNFNQAIHYYAIALDGAVQSEDLQLQRELNQHLGKCYAQLGKFEKAYAYHQRYLELLEKQDDSYKNAVHLDAKFKEQEKREALLSKDKKIALANLQKAQLKNDLQRKTIYALSIGALLIILALLAFFRSRQHQQKAIIAEKNMRIEQQKMEQLLKEMELKSLNSMLEGQEEERQRIATDLHDRLGSMLSMVKLHFSSIDEHLDTIKEINKTQYILASALLDDACAEVRKIAHNMISGVLDKFGLVAALEDLAQSLNHSEKVTVEFIPFGMDTRLDRNLEIALYRIVQELITNTLKHANAKEITIQLLQSKDNLNLIVEDDGIGFDPETSFEQGMGLKNTESRVHHINGQLKIDSSLGSGTTISIDIPKPKSERND